MRILNRSLLAIFYFCAVAFAPANSLLAQNPSTVQSTVPFEFWIGGSRLPAGVYQLEHIESSAYIFFRSADGTTTHDVYTVPLDDTPVAEQDAKLVFRFQNGRHYLYEGWGPYGKRVVTAESSRPEPSGQSRVEVPISYP